MKICLKVAKDTLALAALPAHRLIADQIRSQPALVPINGEYKLYIFTGLHHTQNDKNIRFGLGSHDRTDAREE